MNVLAFDTHRVVKRLMEAGFSDTQAETVTDVLRESRELDVGQLATKADLTNEIALLKTELKGEIDALRAELKGEIDALRAELRGEIDAFRAELKGEIDTFRAEFRGDIDTLRAELKSGTDKVKVDILKWVVPLLIGQVALYVAIVKLI